MEHFQILNTERIDLRQFLIGCIGILDFLDLLLLTENSFAVNNTTFK